ncbi:hypothetical protein BOTBODRAFT_169032 [Botryobasidium botryosum FD-172 SS1]|uniref:Beta-lactamase-related domain-containing protein n=1 Tax=Botryobasidium botryosum (strain FD-172 SS1) TaxID=930990 RepID=A0A067NDL6_BOTB1|nr:hypothetical protein BOTBODRAFT_169032 [Botryobasidium botryosum FD-172 SS1]
MASDKREDLPVYAQAPPRHPSLSKFQLITLATTFLAILSLACTKLYPRAPRQFSSHEDAQCRAPLPQFLVNHHLSADHPALRRAARNLDQALDAWFSKGGLDSIAVAVVTSDGSVYEEFRGVLRANETASEKRGLVDRHSIYRLGSNSKLFTCLESFILRDRGVVNLDESLDKMFPDLSRGRDPITMRQLMSHMSGIGADWPPGDAEGKWPKSRDGAGPPPYNGRHDPDIPMLLDAIGQNPFVARPYTFPSYSNSGYSLLGVANVAANQAAEGSDAPSTHAELMHRDIFVPLGLNGSSFIASNTNKNHLVVASVYPGEIDHDLGVVNNPAAGQMGSLSDLVKVMQTLIDPNRPGSLLRPYTIREWLRPMHAWWDDYSETGLLWEIYKSEDSYGRKLRYYQKMGGLPGHYTAFTLAPTSSFGVIVLTSGPTLQLIELNRLVFSHFQPAFDAITEELTERLIAGEWTSVDEAVQITIIIEAGSLFVSKYVVNGTDVLEATQPYRGPSALWSTGDNEFRLATSMPGSGCLLQWIGLDQYGYIRGFPTNMMRIVEGSDGVVLQVPAIDVNLERR